MAIAEVSIIPLGTKTPSVSKYLARSFQALQQEKDIKYELTSMGTIMEEDLGWHHYCHKADRSLSFRKNPFGAFPGICIMTGSGNER